MQEDNIYSQAITELIKIAEEDNTDKLKAAIASIVEDIEKAAAFDLDAVTHDIRDFSDTPKLVAAYLNELQQVTAHLKRVLSHFNKPQEALVRYNASTQRFTSSYVFVPDLETDNHEVRVALNTLRHFARNIKDIGRSLEHAANQLTQELDRNQEPVEQRQEKKPNILQRTLNRFRPSR